MPVPLIETPSQYRELRERIAVLESHLTTIDAVRILARSHKQSGRLEAEDLRDLLPLDDACSDVAYTLRGLVQAVDEWEVRRQTRRQAPQPQTT
jgi:hypothetical protein